MPATGVDRPKPALVYEKIFMPARVGKLAGELLLRIYADDAAVVFRLDLATRPEICHGLPVSSVRAIRQAQRRVFIEQTELADCDLGLRAAKQDEDTAGTERLHRDAVERPCVAHVTAADDHGRVESSAERESLPRSNARLHEKEHRHAEAKKENVGRIGPAQGAGNHDHAYRGHR